MEMDKNKNEDKAKRQSAVKSSELQVQISRDLLGKKSTRPDEIKSYKGRKRRKRRIKQGFWFTFVCTHKQ